MEKQNTMELTLKLYEADSHIGLDVEFSGDHSKIIRVSLSHFSVQKDRSRQICATIQDDGHRFWITGNGLLSATVEDDKRASSRIKKFLGTELLLGFKSIVVTIGQARCKKMIKKADADSCPTLKVFLRDLLRDAVDLKHMIKDQKPLSNATSKDIITALCDQYSVPVIPETKGFTVPGHDTVHYIKEIAATIVNSYHDKKTPMYTSPRQGFQRSVMYAQGRGYVMIVAQSEFKDEKLYKKRNVDEDIDTIQSTFNGHKFHLLKNKTKAEIDEEIQKAVNCFNKPNKNYAFFAWFSLSHGGICQAKVSGKEPKVEVDFMVDIDGEKIFFYKDIVKKFSNSACHGLKGIQATQ